MSERFYFRQLLAGHDFAVGDEVARSMRNFVYAVGDRESGDAVLVDPAYRPAELVGIVEADGLRVVGAVATHYHPDHIGGTLMASQHIAGIAELQGDARIPVHVQAEEVDWVKARTGVGDDVLIVHRNGDVLAVGEIEITLLLTPGHTPGSQCLLVEGRLLSGDTLFIDGCGRTDLPGGDPVEMYKSLSERLAVVSDETVLFPGHLYSPETSLTMGEVRARNYILEPRSAEQWLAMYGS
jgi:glyoxylase-like metal-dependent hydrolase (beta-lactamase superfamily II)